VHMLVVLALALVSMPAILDSMTGNILSAIDEPPRTLLNQVLDQEIDPADRISLAESDLATLGGALSLASVVSEPLIDRRVIETVGSMPSINVGEVEIFSSQGNRFAADVPQGTLGEPQAVVGGYNDAMDRITREILLLLSKGEVLVIWCF